LKERCKKKTERPTVLSVGRKAHPSTLNFANYIPKLSLKYIKFFSYPNNKYKFYNAIETHPNIMIVDEKKIGMAFLNPKTKAVANGLVIYDKPTVKGYVDYFDMMWKNSKSTSGFIMDNAKKELKSRGLKL